jgi:hypothetical protein
MMVPRVLFVLGVVCWSFSFGAALGGLGSGLLVVFGLGVLCFFLAAWIYFQMRSATSGSNTLWGTSISLSDSFGNLRTSGGLETLWEDNSGAAFAVLSFGKLALGQRKGWKSGYVINLGGGAFRFSVAGTSQLLQENEILRFQLPMDSSAQIELVALGDVLRAVVGFQSESGSLRL